jgi:hypothetical protein
MKRGDIEKLLGGYAAGILTEEEKRELFTAALEDQRLFDALAHEEALRELMADPRARAELLDALAPGGYSFWERLQAALRRPAAWGLAGTLAAVVLVAAFVMQTQFREEPAAKPVETAVLQRPVKPESAPPPPRPAEPPATLATRARTGTPAAPKPAAAELDVRASGEEKAAEVAPRVSPLEAPPVREEETPPAPAAPAGAAAPSASETIAAEKQQVAVARDQVKGWRQDQPAPERHKAELPARDVFYSAFTPAGADQAGNVMGAVAAHKIRAADDRPTGLAATSKVASAQAPRLGLRYVLAAEGSQDKAAVAVEANTGGYLYLATRSVQGVWQLIHPPVGVVSEWVQPGTRRGLAVPGEQPPTATLYLIFRPAGQGEPLVPASAILSEAAAAGPQGVSRQEVMESAAGSTPQTVYYVAAPAGARLLIAEVPRQTR